MSDQEIRALERRLADGELVQDELERAWLRLRDIKVLRPRRGFVSPTTSGAIQ